MARMNKVPAVLHQSRSLDSASTDCFITLFLDREGHDYLIGS